MSDPGQSPIKPQHEAVLSTTVIGCFSTVRHNDGRVSTNPVSYLWNGKEFEPRLMLPLSLSYDHRVIDGAVAARFAVHLSNVLGDLRQILL